MHKLETRVTILMTMMNVEQQRRFWLRGGIVSTILHIVFYFGGSEFAVGCFDSECSPVMMMLSLVYMMYFFLGHMLGHFGVIIYAIWGFILGALIGYLWQELTRLTRRGT